MSGCGPGVSCCGSGLSGCRSDVVGNALGELDDVSGWQNAFR